MVKIIKHITSSGKLLIEETYLNKDFSISKTGNFLILFKSNTKSFYSFDFIENKFKTLDFDRQYKDTIRVKKALGNIEEFDLGNGCIEFKNDNSINSIEGSYKIEIFPILENTCYSILEEKEAKGRFFCQELDENHIITSSKVRINMNNNLFETSLEINSITESAIPGQYIDMVENLL